MKIALMLMVFAVLAFAARAQQDTFKNPLLPRGADPWALQHDGKYYCMHTTGSNFVLYVTEDITDLKNARRQVIWTPADSLNLKELWAPEIHFLDGKWYVYVTANAGRGFFRQIFVLENESQDPLQGEFGMKDRVHTDYPRFGVPQPVSAELKKPSGTPSAKNSK